MYYLQAAPRLVGHQKLHLALAPSKAVQDCVDVLPHPLGQHAAAQVQGDQPCAGCEGCIAGCIRRTVLESATSATV
jgi:hypothetical protein